MLQTRNGWQEIVHDNEPLRSYMAIFTPDGPDNWNEVAGLFPAINEIIKRFNLTDVASVSMSAGVLSIIFHTGQPELPSSFSDAGAALTELITH